MIIFLHLFTGAFVDLASFALLCAFPFTGYLRLPRRKNTLITISLILGSALAYAAAGTYLSFILPFDNRLYQAISAVFICCTILCFFWYLYAVRAIWQKKAFIFLFAMTSALFISSICNCILNFLPGPGSWIPDTPITIAATFVSNVVVIPLLCLFLKYFYLPVEDRMSAKEIGYLSIPLLLLFGTFFIVFHIPDMLPVPDTDLSVLVGNLLDNAVSAAATAAGTDRMIRLNMDCSGKMFGVTVDNGFDGDVKQNGRAYLSTKSGGQGLGLKILADIAEKYDGGVEFTHEAVMFHSSVMLRLPSHPARSPLHTDPH